jgi:hypothetical protein
LTACALILDAGGACSRFAAMPARSAGAGEDSAVRVSACDRACLIGHSRPHAGARGARSVASSSSRARPLHREQRRHPVGDGLWDTVTGVDATGLEAADPVTGNAAWFGSVKENGQPAIYAVRIHVADGCDRRDRERGPPQTALPAPFGDVTRMVHDPEFNECSHPSSAARASACCRSPTAISAPSSSTTARC